MLAISVQREDRHIIDEAYEIFFLCYCSLFYNLSRKVNDTEADELMAAMLT
jgi:hypothetical protein